MTNRPMFSPKDPDEVDDRGLDFVNLLSTGETLSGGATVSVSVFAGVDASAASLLFSSASISSTIVWQRLRAGTAGVIYQLEYGVYTSASRYLIGCGLVKVEGC